MVVGLVAPSSGPWHKLHAWSKGFAAHGISTAVISHPPTFSGVRAVAGEIRRLRKATPAGNGPRMLLLRSHWSGPLLLPELLLTQRAGWRLAVEVPTVVAAARLEITTADRHVADKAVRLLVEWLWTPLAWLCADVVVQNCNDKPPWAWVARQRRLTLTNGAVNPSHQIAGRWRTSTQLRFLAVGTISRWHGLDRLIDGLAASATPATVVIAGTGPEIARLKSHVAERGVEDRVHLVGPLQGSRLEEAFGAADVAVGSIGEHRRGSFSLSPLKTRDYLWRGLPMVFTGDDPDLREPVPFALRLPAIDSAVDINAVAEWLHRLRTSSITSEDIHEFARSRFAYAPRAAAVWRRVNDPNRRRRVSRPRQGPTCGPADPA